MTVLRALLLAAAALPAAAVAQAPDIVVRGEAARAEIERILEADNLDSARLTPREVVEIMSGIARGGAPEDFWNAYQRHVQAWARLADVVDRAQAQQGESTFVEQNELAGAVAAIGASFDEVERIARLYHARLPRPHVDTRTIA